MSKTLAQISQAGTSIWLDDLSRERMIDNGKSRSLKSLIAEESVVGVTTNLRFSQAQYRNPRSIAMI